MHFWGDEGWGGEAVLAAEGSSFTLKVKLKSLAGNSLMQANALREGIDDDEQSRK